MHVAEVTPTRVAPGPTGLPEAAPALSRNAPQAPQLGPRAPRARLLVLIGGGLGLILLGMALVLAIAGLNGGLDQKPSDVTAQLGPAPGLTRVPSPATRITPAPAAVAKAAPSSSSTPQLATPTIRPTSAPSLAQPVVALGPDSQASVGGAAQPLLDVRFASGPMQGWLDNPPYASWRDGAYRLQAPQASRFVAIGAPADQVPSDVVVSATFRKTGGPPGGGYGLLVRDESPDPLDGLSQSASAYVMETGDRGDFGIWRRDGDHWVDLVPWTHSDSVRTGGSPNELTARAIGDRLSFSVNGAELAAVQDGTLPSGGVGVFVGGDHNEVALDRFAVRVPD
ncbi:MAG: hypothetical protein ACR2IK_00785 [Chloroflexota bacterium]